MKKIFILLVVLTVLALTYGFYVYFTANSTPINNSVKEFTIAAKKLEWRFEPEFIEISKNDLVKLTVINEDNFDHGFAIDEFGLAYRLPANDTIEIEFTADKSGEFKFYCSVMCSNSEDTSFNLENGKVQRGPFKGTVRGHSDHFGKIIIE